MNKVTYIDDLRKALKVLPTSDREAAIEFYEEYFEDAGSENEARVIEELGEPKELAKKILVDLVDKRYIEDQSEEKSYSADSENEKTSKSSTLRTVLITIAAILALPLSPIVLVLVIVAVVLVFAVIITLIVLCASGIAVLATGFAMIIAALIFLLKNLGASLLLMGVGLLLVGGGILLVVFFPKLIKVVCSWTAKMFGKFVHSKKN